MTPKLILTGFMASGKSAVGGALAARLGWRLVDIDRLIAERAGKPLDALFRECGEAHFRALERQVIAEVAAQSSRCAGCGGPRPAVIATGGGALVDQANYAALARIGVIVCLSARPATIAARVRRSRQRRPKLLESGQPLEARIEELMAERRGAYARAAFTVDTSDLTVEQAADRVLAGFAAARREWSRPGRDGDGPGAEQAGAPRGGPRRR